MQDDSNIPTGFCQCGCGQKTKISPRNVARSGWVKGKPRRFLRGHNPLDSANAQHVAQSLSGNMEKGYIVNPQTGCWEWTRCKDSKGYGLVCVAGKMQRAHRYMYEQCNGPLEEGVQLDHLCRNHSCINPDHVEPVTNAVNTQRGLRAKLTWPEVNELRRLSIEEHLSTVALGNMFDVSQAQAWNIVNNKCWVKEEKIR